MSPLLIRLNVGLSLDRIAFKDLEKVQFPGREVWNASTVVGGQSVKRVCLQYRNLAG